MSRPQGRSVLPAIGLLLAACSGEYGGDETASAGAPPANTPKPIEINLIDHKVQQNNRVVRTIQGDAVELLWHSDKPASLHLHGYDIELAVGPEAPRRMAFHAHAAGRFAITRHESDEHQHQHDQVDQTLMYLEVYPR